MCLQCFDTVGWAAGRACGQSRLVLPFWYRLTQVVLEKRPLNVGMVELCAKNLQIMRNDFTDYARTFCQLCANYAQRF